jgi:hypothetical protein
VGNSPFSVTLQTRLTYPPVSLGGRPAWQVGGIFHAPYAQTCALQDRSRPNRWLRRLIHARLRGRAYRSGSASRIVRTWRDDDTIGPYHPVRTKVGPSRVTNAE